MKDKLKGFKVCKRLKKPKVISRKSILEALQWILNVFLDFINGVKDMKDGYIMKFVLLIMFA